MGFDSKPELKSNFRGDSELYPVVASGKFFLKGNLTPMLNLFRFLILSITFVFIASQAIAFPGGGSSDGKSSSASPARVSAKGSVVETMNAGGYTYVCVENGGTKQWAAIPATSVKVGDEVQIAAGMEMTNFTSKTLGRTFDKIIFSQGVVQQ